MGRNEAQIICWLASCGDEVVALGYSLSNTMVSLWNEFPSPGEAQIICLFQEYDGVAMELPSHEARMLCWLASGERDSSGLRVPHGVRGGQYGTSPSRLPFGGPNVSCVS